MGLMDLKLKKKNQNISFIGLKNLKANTYSSPKGFLESVAVIILNW